MKPQPSIKELLLTKNHIFSDAAKECVSALFQHEAFIKEEWQIVDQLDCNFDFALTLGCANDEYQALVVVGIQNDSFCALLGQDAVPAEEACDVLGEFANTYCGMVSDYPAFREEFGILAQSLPVLYMKGHSYLQFIWGIEGKIYFGDNWIYMGYVIQRRRKE
ncbi:MAG: hypothetical protein HQK76_14120 [Desulfobacterales bacterium]|nr:hypothetical protein [Desulfobacterales bacterium]